MTRRRLIKLSATLAILSVALVTAGMIYISRADRQSAIQAATEWARLAPLPSSARDLHVDVKGTMFTREFVISFRDSPAAIQQWLVASPGPSSAATTILGPITTYAISPGGGASFAEVKVDANEGKVVISTYWS